VILLWQEEARKWSPPPGGDQRPLVEDDDENRQFLRALLEAGLEAGVDMNADVSYQTYVEGYLNTFYNAAAKVPNVITFSGNRRGMDDRLGADNCVTFLNKVKKQAEDTIAAEAAAKVAKKVPVKPEAPPEPETPGIARKAGEGYAEYSARVRGVQSNLAEGKTALEKQEFPVALARFRLVDRDAPKFQGVDALIADALAKQQKAVDVAIDSGQQNETANKILEARRWYDVALQRDPASVVAREKRAAVVLKMNAAAEALYNQATYAQKSGNVAKANDLFKQIIDSTMPGDEFREKATKQMEALKR